MMTKQTIFWFLKYQYKRTKMSFQKCRAPFLHIFDGKLLTGYRFSALFMKSLSGQLFLHLSPISFVSGQRLN